MQALGTSLIPEKETSLHILLFKYEHGVHLVMEVPSPVTTQPRYFLSNFKIRCDVTHDRLCISCELPLNACVVYGNVAKHVRCMVTRLNYASTLCDIASNLEVGQRVQFAEASYTTAHSKLHPIVTVKILHVEPLAS